MGLFTCRSPALRYRVLDVQASSRITNVRNCPRLSFVTVRCVDDVHQTIRIYIYIYISLTLLLHMHKIHVMKKQFYHFSTPVAYSQKKEGKAWFSAFSHAFPSSQENRLVYVKHTHTHTHTHIQGPPKKCIHALTKENSIFFVSTNFNYTSQVEYTLQWSIYIYIYIYLFIYIIDLKLNTRYSRVYIFIYLFIYIYIYN